jgi:type III secretory pathway component EscV
MDGTSNATALIALIIGIAALILATASVVISFFLYQSSKRKVRYCENLIECLHNTLQDNNNNSTNQNNNTNNNCMPICLPPWMRMQNNKLLYIDVDTVCFKNNIIGKGTAQFNSFVTTPTNSCTLEKKTTSIYIYIFPFFY